MTAPSFRAAATQGDINGGTWAISKPTGTVDNDWMVAGVVASEGQAITTVPAGWTELYLDPVTQDFGVWCKKAASEGASYTWGTTGGSNPRTSSGFIVSIKDADPNMVPTIGLVTKQTSASVKGLSLTPGAGAAMIFEIGACTSQTSDIVTATPVGMTERVDFEEHGSAAQTHIHCNEAYVLPYGPSGDKTATLSASKANWGVNVILYQTPLSAGTSDGAGQETLIELTHWDEGLAAETTKKYSSRGVIFSGGEAYEPRILSAVEIAQTAADSIAVGGIIASTISAVRIDNKDGALDTIYANGLAAGRGVVVKTVRVTEPVKSDLGAGAVSNAVTVFSGIVGALTPEGDAMVLRISDLTSRLDVPLQIDQYDGTSGFGGGAENKGLTMPALFGRCYNMRPHELGTISGLETYQVHSRTVNDILNVFIRGVVQIEVGGTPTAGEYANSSGGFQVGASPDGDVTCTAQGDLDGTYASQHGEVIDRMLKTFGPELAAGDVESSTFTAVDAVLPGEIGIYFPAGDKSTTRDAIARVLRSGGIWLAGGRNGKLHLSMARPMVAERLALTLSDIVELRPVGLPAALQPAPHEIAIFTERNWFPLADIAPSVTGSTRRKLSGPGRTVRSTSALISARQKIPRHWEIDGLWRNDDEGQVCADQIRIWIEQGLIPFEVTTDRYRNQVELGMGCEIDSYPRYGLEGGFAGIVAAWREAPAKGRVTMLLIGAAPSGILLLEDASPMLLEDGTFNLLE